MKCLSRARFRRGSLASAAIRFNRCEPVIDQTGDESRELVSFSFVIALREFSATQSATPVPPVK
jgi:hypothetical protein